MKTVRNLKEHVSGLIDCEILIGEDWNPHSIEVSEKYVIHESSEWEGVKSCPQLEKEAYAIEQSNSLILYELASLDASPRLLEEAALGDKAALDKLAEIKVKKEELRANLA